MWFGMKTFNVENDPHLKHDDCYDDQQQESQSNSSENDLQLIRRYYELDPNFCLPAEDVKKFCLLE